MYQKAKVEASEKEHIAAPASTMLADAWIRLKKNKAAVVALFILIGIILLAIFAPIFSKYSFRDTDYNNVYGLPSAAHIFGADQFGRDLWVRTWMGTRISLMIALVAAILDLVVGVLYGAVSALFGGKVDAVMQRIIEVLVGIPSLIIVINVMFTIPSAIFTEAFLSFIGIGLAEPQASLGVLINGGYQVLRMYPHVLIFPAIVIVLIMVCFSILGDGLRDALDPQMRK